MCLLCLAFELYAWVMPDQWVWLIMHKNTLGPCEIDTILLILLAIFSSTWPTGDYPMHKLLQSGQEIELVGRERQGGWGVPVQQIHISPSFLVCTDCLWYFEGDVQSEGVRVEVYREGKPGGGGGEGGGMRHPQRRDRQPFSNPPSMFPSPSLISSWFGKASRR